MRKTILAIIAVIAIGLLAAGCGNKISFVPDTVATVNGEPITAAEYLEDLHRRIGQETLNNMIERKILVQWAKEENVPVTEEQIKKQIEILKRDGMYEDQLKYQGEAGMRAELEAMQARINLAGKLIKVNDNDLKATYDMMKDRYVHGPRKRLAIIINSDRNKIEEAEKVIKQDKRDFEEVAWEYTNRQYLMRDIIKIWYDKKNNQGMPKELIEAADKTKNGEVSGIFTIAMPNQPAQYGLLKVIGEMPAQNLKFEDVKEEIKNNTLLQKAQFDAEFQRAFNEQKKKADIKINVDEFKGIIYNFKNPAEPMPMMPSPPPQQAPKPEPKKQNN